MKKITILAVLVGLLITKISSAEQPTKLSDKQKQQAHKELIKKMGKQDGKAFSLEPLTKQQCFGETHSRVAVESLLNQIYADDYPISGLGLFLGFDKKSTAIKNKEFRYYFEGRDESQDFPMFKDMLRFAENLYSLLGYKGRPFELTKETYDEIWSRDDMPALFVENIGRNLDEVSNFEPYEQVYWDILKDDSKASHEKIKEIKADAISVVNGFLEDKEVKGERGFQVNAQIAVLNFSDSRFGSGAIAEGLKVHFSNFYAYYYNYSRENDLKKFKKSSNLIVNGINGDFFLFALGKWGSAFKSDYQVKVNSILKYRRNKKKVMMPTAFDKSLFLAVFTRIKPLNMAKERLINDVLTVMEPCLN